MKKFGNDLMERLNFPMTNFDMTTLANILDQYIDFSDRPNYTIIFDLVVDIADQEDSGHIKRFNKLVAQSNGECYFQLDDGPLSAMFKLPPPSTTSILKITDQTYPFRLNVVPYINRYLFYIQSPKKPTREELMPHIEFMVNTTMKFRAPVKIIDWKFSNEQCLVKFIGSDGELFLWKFSGIPLGNPENENIGDFRTKQLS